MTTTIKAVFIGDSHGMIMQSAAAAAGIRFEYPITAASAMFGGATLTLDDSGQAKFEIAQTRLDPARVAAEKATHRLHKAASIENRFRTAFGTGLPFYSNIGMTARNFVLGIVSAAKANGEDASNMSGKVMRLAATEYFTPFANMYETMTSQASKVVAVFGPTRFEESNRRLWMAYDDVASLMLQERGVEVLDLRQTLGDSDLLLRPEYHGDPDDGVHGGDHWGLTVVRAIEAHLATSNGDQPVEA